MEENRLEQQKEIVFTYRQEELVQPVVLRYERDLPGSMLPPPPPPDEEEEDYLAPWRSAIAPPEKPKKSRLGVQLFVGVSLLLALVCLGVGIWYMGQHGWMLPNRVTPDEEEEDPPAWEDRYYWDYGDKPGLSDTPRETTIGRYPTGGEARLLLSATESRPPLTPGEIYEKVNPSVVSVLGSQTGYSSVGTGVIFSEDGYVLTNFHVISGCRSCEVLVTDHAAVVEYDAKLVGYDEDMDLAVLKIAAVGLPPAEFGISDDLQIGDPCYAIGNPLGLELRNTFTNGIISAVSRSVDVDGVDMTLIQTNTALNSGNSGGPLINQYGQVVGINTIKMMSEYDTIEGLGFAIPTSLAERWVNELVMFGELQPQPILGISIQQVNKTFQDGFQGLLLVVDVQEGKSGENAGVHVGDYVVAFNGQEVTTTEEILAIRRGLFVGDEVPVRVYRRGEFLDLMMTMMS
ncbi:MAG: trypsin-like peptidase domain-containing protein [Oscillospiraceae bacterium]|nr:trypsin-like peptidase domain-containing protein [Oscillospiraceae bacterium]